MVIFLAFSTFGVSAQQGNIWCFGTRAGLNFNNTNPTSFTQGQTTNLEGSATICDSVGNLLFYTDGMTVWDRNHNVMETGLLGHNSSTQSGVIVPAPMNSNKYYIFTIDATQNNLNNGLRYTEVDMTLRSGLGDVVSGKKNVLLSPSGVKMGEKITGVRHCNNVDIWVVGHGYGITHGNKFYAYQITPSGIVTTPVISTVGTNHWGADESGLGNSRGYMKASPDGSKIAVAISYDGTPALSGSTWWQQFALTNNYSTGSFEVFDFDYTSGQVSNPIKFYGNDFKGAYGIAFSPNSNILYGGTWGAYGSSIRIYQWNLDAGTTSQVQNSKTLIASRSTGGYGALQIAPDGKIYIARYNFTYLSAINYPNKLGSSCGYTDVAVSLSPRRSQYGLPTFIQSYFDPNLGYTYRDNFEDMVTKFQIIDSVRIDSVKWFFNDPGTTEPDTSSSFSPNFQFSDTGNYSVLLLVYKCNIIDSILHTITIWPRPDAAIGLPANDTDLCFKNQPFNFINNTTIESGSVVRYRWHFGDGDTSANTNPSHTYPYPGIFDVKLIAWSDKGGIDSTSQKVRVIYSPDAAMAVFDSTQCLDSNVFVFDNSSMINSSSSLSFYWDMDNTDTFWRLNPPFYHFNTSDSFIVKLVAISDSGCTDTASQKVFVYPMPEAGFSINDSAQCFNERNFQFTNSSSISWTSVNYKWYFGDGDSAITTNTSHLYDTTGTFLVELYADSDQGCRDSMLKYVTINPSPNPQINADLVTLCEDKIFNFFLSGADTFFWQTNYGILSSTSDSDSVSVSPPATNVYEIIAKNNYNCLDTITSQVNVFALPIVDAGNNDTLCYGDSTQLHGSGGLIYAWTPSTGLSDSTIANPIAQPQQTTTYHLTVANRADELVPNWNFNSGNSGFTSSYNYNSNLVPEGNYYITTDPNSTHPNFASCGDLTTGTGNMMVVNGASTANVIVWSKTINVTKYTNYAFSTWVTSVYPANPARLQFSIDGQLLGQPFNATSTSCDWNQFYEVWYSDTNTTATISIINQNTIASGNDFALDDISFAPLCENFDSVTIVVNPTPVANFSINDSQQCFNENNFVFTNSTSIDSGIINYSWSFGDGNNSGSNNTTHKYATADTFDVELRTVSDNGCFDSIIKRTYIFPSPNMAFNINDTDQCININSFNFQNNTTISSGNLSHNWNFGDLSTSTDTSPVHWYQSVDTFDARLISTSDLNCPDTLIKQVLTFPKPNSDFYITTDTAQCLSSNYYNFRDTSSIQYGSITNYLWKFGDFTTSSSQHTSHVYTFADTYAVNLITTSNYGCRDTFTENILVQPNCLDLDQIEISTSLNVGLVAYYPMEGNGNDNSGNNRHLTNFGSTTSSGIINDAMSFDGFNDYMERFSDGGFTPDTSSWTIAAWIKVDSSIPQGHIFKWYRCGANSTCGTSDDANYSMYFENRKVHFNVRDDNSNINILSSTNFLDDGEWHFIVGTFEPGNDKQTLYVDGCIDSTITRTLTSLTAGSINVPLSIGRVYRTGWASPRSYFNGDIDEARIYNRAINEREVEILWRQGRQIDVEVSNQQACLTDSVIIKIIHPQHDIRYEIVDTITKNVVGEAQFGECDTLFFSSGSITDTSYFIIRALDTTTTCGTILDTVLKVFNYPQPQPDFTINDTSQCLTGNSYQFTNTTNIYSGSYTSLWDFGDNNSSDSLNPVHSYASFDSFDVKLIVTSDFNCKDSVEKRTYVRPMPEAFFVENDSSQCFYGNIFEFEDSSSVAYGSYTTFWDFDDGQVTTSTDPIYSFGAADTFNVSLIATSNYNCSDTFTRPEYVRPMPVADFNINDTNQCFNENLFHFDNASTISSGTLVYTWNLGDNTTSAIDSPSHVYARSDTFTIKLITGSAFNCKDSIEKSVIINPSPNLSFTVNDSNQCFNSNYFTFYNSSTLKGGSIAYDWDFGDGNGDTTSNISHTYLTSDTFNVRMIGTSNLGCPDTVYQNIYVFPNPVASFSINDIDQCLNHNSFQLFNSSTISSGPITYLWDFDDNNTSIMNDPVHIYSAADSYNIKLVVTSNLNCLDSTTQKVYVRPHPNSDFAINDSSQCFVGNNYSFTDLTSLTYGNWTNSWLFGDGNSSTQKNTSNSYATIDTYSVRLITLSQYGCSDSIEKNIYRPMPVAGFTINDSAQCERGNLFSFTNTSSVYYGSMNYEWYFGDGDTAASANASHPYSYPDTFDVRLIAITNHGCRDTLEKNTYVHYMPTSDFAINQDQQCFEGNNFVFTNISSLFAGSMSYSWSFGDADTSSNINVSHQYQIPDTFPVTLVTTSDNNCIDTITKDVFIFPNPVADYAIFDSSQCFERNAFGFTNQTTILSGSSTYMWDFGDSNTSTLENPVHSYTYADTFLVKLIATSDLGCTDSVSGYTYLHVNPEPVAGFSITDSAQCLSFNDFEFNNLSTITVVHSTVTGILEILILLLFIILTTLIKKVIHSQ